MHRLRKTVRVKDPSDPTGHSKLEAPVAPQWVRNAKGRTIKLSPGDTCELAPEFVTSLGDLVEPVSHPTPATKPAPASE